METQSRGDGSARDTGRGDEQETRFEALSHPYRRFGLQSLAGTDGSRTVSEVVTALAARQADLPVADRSTTGVDVIGSALHHRYFPNLAAAGMFVDDSTRTVTPGRRAAETSPYLAETGGSVVQLEHDRTTQ